MKPTLAVVAGACFLIAGAVFVLPAIQGRHASWYAVSALATAAATWFGIAIKWRRNAS